MKAAHISSVLRIFLISAACGTAWNYKFWSYDSQRSSNYPAIMISQWYLDIHLEVTMVKCQWSRMTSKFQGKEKFPDTKINVCREQLPNGSNPKHTRRAASPDFNPSRLTWRVNLLSVVNFKRSKEQVQTSRRERTVWLASKTTG